MSEADEQRAVVGRCAWRRIPVFRIPGRRQQAPGGGRGAEGAGREGGRAGFVHPRGAGRPDRPECERLV